MAVARQEVVLYVNYLERQLGMSSTNMPLYRIRTACSSIAAGEALCLANVQCDCLRSGCQVVRDLRPIYNERQLAGHREGVKHNSLFLSLNSNMFRSAHILTELYDVIRPNPPTAAEIAKVAAPKLLTGAEVAKTKKIEQLQKKMTAWGKKVEGGTPGGLTQARGENEAGPSRHLDEAVRYADDD